MPKGFYWFLLVATYFGIMWFWVMPWLEVWMRDVLALFDNFIGRMVKHKVDM